MSEWNAEAIARAAEEVAKLSMSVTTWTDTEVKAILEAADAEPRQERPEMGRPIFITAAQRRVFEAALRAFREAHHNPNISEGRMVELISAEVLTSAGL